jgi:RND family efflux transporter MFP subunit
LLTLIQAAPLIAEVAVSELWLPRLRVGDPVTLGIDALPGRTFTATIGRIHPTVDRSSRQGIVELVLDPVPDGARPGQFCRVTFRAPSHQALLLPFASLQYDSDGEYVMAVGADGKVHRTAVVTGDGYDDRLELRSGLEPGARVVVRGLLGLEDGSLVSIDAAEDLDAAED